MINLFEITYNSIRTVHVDKFILSIDNCAGGTIPVDFGGVISYKDSSNQEILTEAMPLDHEFITFFTDCKSISDIVNSFKRYYIFYRDDNINWYMRLYCYDKELYENLSVFQMLT